jgi:hypothetical protein
MRWTRSAAYGKIRHVWKWAAATMFVVTLAGCGRSAANAERRPEDGHFRATIALVGDSNLELAATSLGLAANAHDPTYLFVDAARKGAAIRYPSSNFWKVRLTQLERVDGYVVNLGINDAGVAAISDGRGFSGYRAKVDWMMGLMPRSKPVWWTNLPCAIEPASTRSGCAVVNRALAGARARWSNLRVLDWAAVADSHPEYLPASLGGIHLSGPAAGAWARLVGRALDREFGR